MGHPLENKNRGQKSKIGNPKTGESQSKFPVPVSQLKPIYS